MAIIFHFASDAPPHLQRRLTTHRHPRSTMQLTGDCRVGRSGSIGNFVSTTTCLGGLESPSLLWQTAPHQTHFTARLPQVYDPCICMPPYVLQVFTRKTSTISLRNYLFGRSLGTTTNTSLIPHREDPYAENRKVRHFSGPGCVVMCNHIKQTTTYC